MDSDAGTCSLKERDEEEAEFFGQGAWTELPRASLGIDRLRGRLSKVLLRQIALELPGLIDEIDHKSKDCALRLLKLGMPRSDLATQRRYLFELSHSFQTLIKSSVDGTYSGPFFGDANSDEGYKKRIRAVVQNMSENFATRLQIHGHYRAISGEADDESDDEADDESDDGTDDNTASPTPRVTITRAELLKHINVIIHKTRGRELPGTFNPLIVSDLFVDQSQPWQAIVGSHVRRVWNAARAFIDLVISHVADGSTSKTLQKEVFVPAMVAILKDMESKTAELLNSHKNNHPITYNHYFTETVQNLRRERMEKAIGKTIQNFFKLPSDPAQSTASTRFDQIDWPLNKLVTSLASCNEPNMNEFAAQEALDCLKAYYKVFDPNC